MNAKRTTVTVTVILLSRGEHFFLSTHSYLSRSLSLAHTLRCERERETDIERRGGGAVRWVIDQGGLWSCAGERGPSSYWQHHTDRQTDTPRCRSGDSCTTERLADKMNQSARWFMVSSSAVRSALMWHLAVL